MATQLQTVELKISDKNKTILKLDYYPVCPCPYPFPLGKESVVGVKEPGSVYVWYEDGGVSVTLADGKQLYFYPKPTMVEAVNSVEEGMYIRFFEDGSVEQTMYEDGPVYWWGPEIK